MTKKEELIRDYEALKENCIALTLWIHMPTGEIETITNPNVVEKMKYVEKTYTDELVHTNCLDIYIESWEFKQHEKQITFGQACDLMKYSGVKIKKTEWGEKEYAYHLNSKSRRRVARELFGENNIKEGYLKDSKDKATELWIPTLYESVANDYSVVM